MLGNAREHCSFVSLVYSHACSMYLLHLQHVRLRFQENEQQLQVDRRQKPKACGNLVLHQQIARRKVVTATLTYYLLASQCFVHTMDEKFRFGYGSILNSHGTHPNQSSCIYH